MQLSEVVRYCDDYLRISSVRDAPEAMNGLQVGNDGRITRIAAAVDLCAATVAMAAQQQADFMIVHHGLFWGGPHPFVGPMRDRLGGLLQHNIALYGAHIPLDCHPEVGNAALLAGHLGVSVHGEFATWRGQAFGLWGELASSRDALRERLTAILGAAPKEMAFGPSSVQRVGIATGAGGSLIHQAAQAGLDTYITGEGNHHSFFDAEELHLNVYYGGHYATETFGVRALARHLGERFSLPWVFLDHPTGL
jgi:dinuclear metal center YbgI/SA1388 family protein